MKELLEKLFPLLMNNRGEVDTSTAEESSSAENTSEDVTPSMEDLISESLEDESLGGNKNEGNNDSVSSEDNEDKDSKDEVKDEKKETVESNDGKDKTEDDPEIELDYEGEDGKPARMKMSEVKQSLKWIKENSQTVAGALKIRQLANDNPEFGKLVNAVFENSISEDGKINNDYVSKSLKALDAKAEKVEEAIEDKDEDIEAAEAYLEELDPDSSEAMIWKKNIKLMKAQKEQLKNALNKIDSITEKIEGIDKKNEDSEKASKQAEHQKQVETYRKTFENEYSEGIKGIEFINDGEKKRFEAQVRNLVAGQSDKIVNDEAFKKIIKESVKAVHDELKSYHESIRNDYLKKKGKTKTKPETKEKTDPNKEVNQESLEAEIEKLLMEGEGEG